MLTPTDIEIIEHGDADSGVGIVCPSEVRINGVPVMASAQHPVIIHEIDVNNRNAVYVTMTFIARRVRIGFDDEIGAP